MRKRRNSGSPGIDPTERNERLAEPDERVVEPPIVDEGPVQEAPVAEDNAAEGVFAEDSAEGNTDDVVLPYDDAANESVLLSESTPGSLLPPERETATVEPDTTGVAAIGESPEPDPLERLEPIAPDTPMDPGTGTYQDRWNVIQGGFIDDPRQAVTSASALIAELWAEIERSNADERQNLEARWQDTQCSTDDLRSAMQDYRQLYTRYTGFMPESR